MRIQMIKLKNPIIFSIIIATITIGGLILISYITSFILSGIFTETTDYYYYFFINEFIIAIFVIGIAYICGNLYTLRRKGVGLLRSFAIGAYPTVLIILLAFIMYTSELFLGSEILSGLHIAIYLGSMLLIGLVEELIFRGVIAETLLNHYATSRQGIWKAVVISGFIFGIAHVGNVLDAELLGVFVQMAVASVMGMLFTAIYFRSQNLLICILIHAGLDAASLMSSGVFGVGTAEELISSFSLLNLIPCITYFIPVLYLLRKSKITEILGNKTEEN